MKNSKFVVTITALLLSFTLFSTSVSASSYSAMIVQGNTSDVGDCKVFFEGLKSVPNGNTYSIWTKGWHYNNGNSYHNYTKWLQGYSSNSEYALACAQNLIDAKNRDVLYWSGHGGRKPISLNVHPSGGTDYGPGSSQQPAFSIPSVLNVSEDNWYSSCVWNKNTNLKVVIFGACRILDNTYDDCKYLVRAMKASNVRVIAGYHLTSPTSPYDTYIASDFFNNSTNGGVCGGESIRLC